MVRDKSFKCFFLKWFSLGSVGLIMLLAALYVILTHGYLWSIYTPIYDRLLHSIPSPPGLVAETERIDLNPEWPWSFREYHVDADHTETVVFFASELPHAGWDVLEHDSRFFESGWVKPGTYLKSDDMLFSRNQRYWLIVQLLTRTDEEGVPLDETWVLLEIYRNEELARTRFEPATPRPPTRPTSTP